MFPILDNGLLNDVSELFQSRTKIEANPEISRVRYFTTQFQLESVNLKSTSGGVKSSFYNIRPDISLFFPDIYKQTSSYQRLQSRADSKLKKKRQASNRKDLNKNDPIQTALLDDGRKEEGKKKMIKK